MAMPADVTREEFDHVKTRLSVVEREVEGEKLVTRHILEQTRRNGDDLAAVKTRLDRVERKVDGLEQKLGGLEQKVGGLEHNLNGLRKDLPKIVGDTVREVLRERDGER